MQLLVREGPAVEVQGRRGKREPVPEDALERTAGAAKAGEVELIEAADSSSHPLRVLYTAVVSEPSFTNPYTPFFWTDSNYLGWSISTVVSNDYNGIFERLQKKSKSTD